MTGFNPQQQANVDAAATEEKAQALMAKYIQRNRKKRGNVPANQMPAEDWRRMSISFKHGRKATRKGAGMRGITARDIGLHGTSTSARGGGSLGTYWAAR